MHLANLELNKYCVKKKPYLFVKSARKSESCYARKDHKYTYKRIKDTIHNSQRFPMHQSKVKQNQQNIE